MTVKRRNLYLFLALACFLGIIVIFIFDGYLGVYDSLVMDNGQFPQKVEADQWQRQEKFGYFVSTSVDRGGRIEFTYTVENHRFTAYTAGVQASLWYNQDKLADLKAGQVAAGAFGQGELKWTLDVREFVPADFPPEQGYNMNVDIKRGDIVRKVVVYISPLPVPPKPLIAPSR